MEKKHTDASFKMIENWLDFLEAQPDGDQQEERLAQDLVVDHLLEDGDHGRHAFVLVVDDAWKFQKRPKLL